MSSWDKKYHKNWAFEECLPKTSYEDDPGTFVRRLLSQRPNIMRLPTSELDIFVSNDFLASPECFSVCQIIDSERQPSKLLAAVDPDFRTSETCYFWSKSELVRELEHRIDTLMGIDRIYGERWQGQRYSKGQQFKPHHDFFHVDQPYWAAQEQSGGQRTWTVMAFLNAPQSGGETVFPNIGLRITPFPGSLVIWNNLDTSNRPNSFSLHEGTQVQAGLKYVLTKWYREKPTPHAATY